jgi:hypothetical protein
MSVARSGHVAVSLNDGRVLIAGGMTDGNSPATTLYSAEVCNASTASFTTTGSLLVARSVCSASLPADGRVLIAGGYDDGGNVLASAELFDPISNTFSSAGTMTSPRAGHAVGTLATGDVLMAGGANASGKLASAELFRAPPPRVGPPMNIADCKGGGWSRFNSPRSFKNQGDCIQFVNTGKLRGWAVLTRDQGRGEGGTLGARRTSPAFA